MLTNSIAHVLQSVLQYIALVTALLLYRWIKDVSSFSGSPYSKRTRNLDRHILKGRSTRTLIYEELFILYQWIRQLRKRRNLTQEKLAEKMGVDPRTVQRWENGSTRPQPHNLSKFQTLEERGWETRRAQRRRYKYSRGAQRKRGYSPASRRILLVPYLLGLFILIVLLVFLILHFWLHII